MIHWPDPPFLIAGTLCGFDRDPMTVGVTATCVAQVHHEAVAGDLFPWVWTTDANREDGWNAEMTQDAAQRAAEAAIGGEA